jgi:hypothetical protein
MQLSPTRERITTRNRIYTPSQSLALQRRQSAVRLGVAWFLALVSLVATYAVAWDVQWHTEFGRDSFWSAPHNFIYASIALTGIVALLLVLYETWLYHWGSPAVTPKNSSGFLKFFYAPAGFYLVGFSMLSNVVAAPLDNYWHELYGIDVTIWAPFHSMAIVGSILARFGILIVIASEYNRHRSRQKLGQTDRMEQWLGRAALFGLVVAMAGIFSGVMLLISPSNQAVTLVFKLWGWDPIIYSSLLALLIPFTFIGLVLGTGKPGLATLTALLLTLFRWVMLVTVQGLTETSATAEGLIKIKRPTDGLINIGVVIPDSFPVYLILYGLLIDLAFLGMVWLWARRHQVSHWRNLAFNFGPEQSQTLSKWLLNPVWLAGLGAVVALIATLLDRPYLNRADQLQAIINLPQVVAAVGPRLQDFVYPELLPTLPMVIIVGAVAGWLSGYFAVLLRYQEK